METRMKMVENYDYISLVLPKREGRFTTSRRGFRATGKFMDENLFDRLVLHMEKDPGTNGEKMRAMAGLTFEQLKEKMERQGVTK